MAESVQINSHSSNLMLLNSLNSRANSGIIRYIRHTITLLMIS